MAEKDPRDSTGSSDNLLELQPFQSLGLEQLETVKALSGSGGTVQVHLHQHQHSTVVKGDVVQGSKTDVKDSAIGTLTLPTGDSQSQALREPLIQNALPWTDGEELDIESTQQRTRLLSEQQSNPLDHRERFSSTEGSDDEMLENIERTPETISSARMRMPVKRDHGLQTIVPITFEEESQTEIIFRDKMAQTNEELKFDTEAQTDNPRTRDRELQTDVYVMDSDSQTFSVISQRTNSYAQTVNKVSSDTDVQTEILDQSTNQTQTEIKSYQENEFQTYKVETLDANSQTNEQTLLHPAIMEGFANTPSNDKSALEMIELYKNERTEQDVGDFLPLLETIWKSIQVKIILKSIEKQLVRGMLVQLPYIPEQNLSTFISREDDVYKVGKQFASENNYIHAVISFYSAANLYRINNKKDNSVVGINFCVHQIAKMTKHHGIKNIVIDHVIPLMLEMKDYVQSIQGSSRDFKVEMEAMCLLSISACYNHYDEYQQDANMNESAIELMKKHFKHEVAKQSIYGYFLYNAGVAYDNLGDIEKSIAKYKISLKAYEKANDWDSDEEKTNLIAAAENNLKIAEEKLLK